jgi:hypothetical protein
MVALVESKPVEVVAEAAALAVILRAQNQNRIVLMPGAFLEGVELLTLRHARGFSIITDNFGLSLIVGSGVIGGSLYSVELGRSATTERANANVLDVTDRAGGGGETGQEGDGEEKSEAHSEMRWREKCCVRWSVSEV